MTDRPATVTPATAAKSLGHSRDFVMALIRKGELPATDERSVGSSLPRYRINPADLDHWRESRRYVPAGEPTRAARPRVVVTGLLAYRREKRRRREALVKA
jgi:excisionase family DNA binding protein